MSLYTWIGALCIVVFLLCVLYSLRPLYIELREKHKLHGRLTELAGRALLVSPDDSSSEELGRLNEKMKILKVDFANHDNKYPR